METRPLSVTIIGWLFIATGCISLCVRTSRFIADLGHAVTPELAKRNFLELVVAGCSAILAIVGGAFVLRRRNWARWLCLAWMGAHVILSLRHSSAELIMHGVFFALILFFLWRPPSSAYFVGWNRTDQEHEQ